MGLRERLLWIGKKQNKGGMGARGILGGKRERESAWKVERSPVLLWRCVVAQLV